MHDEMVAQLEPLTETVHVRQSILVIDDDVDQAGVLRHRLESQGFDVLIAHSGRNGLHLARTEHPSLVLLDLRLPDVDGMNVCAQLADCAETCVIPVIILSGMERPDVIRRARSAGGQFYVRKPYDPNVLLLLIRSSLRQSEPW